MTKVVDMEQRRSEHALKLKDAKTRELREAFRKAREAGSAEEQALLRLFSKFERKKPPKKR